MKYLLIFPALYLAIDALGWLVILWYRRGQPRLGPVTSPNGTRFWVINDDPLATALGTQAHCTTIARTVGRSIAETTQGISVGLAFHEIDVHIRRQWWVVGPISAVLMLPAYLALDVLGHGSPFEVVAYREQARIMALPETDPERQAWQQVANQINATHPVAS